MISILFGLLVGRASAVCVGQSCTFTSTDTRTSTATVTATSTITATITATATTTATATVTSTLTIPLSEDGPLWSQILATNLAAYYQQMAVAGTPWAVNPNRRIINGEFRVGVGFVTGSASAQNLVSIENPTASPIKVYVKRMDVDGIASAASTVLYLYRVSRTTGLPSGTPITVDRRASSEATAVAVVRSVPTATAASGDLHVTSPGTLLTIAGGFAPTTFPIFESSAEVNDEVLAPGEAVMVRCEANAVTWSHYVNIFWQEGP